MYNGVDTRASFGNHGEDCSLVRRAPLYYRLCDVFVIHTRLYRITQSAKFYPTHCKIPAIFEDDGTLITASDLLEQMLINVPSTKCKLRYTKVLQYLATIMNNDPPPKVDTSVPQKVRRGMPRQLGAPPPYLLMTS